MKKKYTNLILTISIFIALSTIAALLFFFKVIANKNEHTSKVMLTLAEKMEDRQNSETLTSKFTELEAIYQEINGHFVDPSKIDTFVDYLEKLGSDNGTELIVKNVEISQKEKDNIFVKVSVTGDFSNVMKIIFLLENAPYYVNLNQVFINKEIKKTEEETKEGKKEIINSFWTADVSFNILSLPQ